MLFELCKCPKCGERDYAPNYDETLEVYSSNEFKNYNNLIVVENSLPKSPDYLIFKCEVCSYTEKISHLDTIKMISNGWVEIAWMRSKLEAQRAVQFEEHLTRFILDKTLGRFITEEELNRNPFLKDFIRTIEKNEAKYIKESDD